MITRGEQNVEKISFPLAAKVGLSELQSPDATGLCYVRIHTHMRACARIHTNTHIHTRTRARARTQIHAHVGTYKEREINSSQLSPSC